MQSTKCKVKSVDREKVIRGLECCIDGGAEACLECPYCADLNVDDFGNTHWHCRDLRKDALALLKAQEPVELTWRKGLAYCGKCGERLGRAFKYCPECGRAVK